MHQSSYIMKMNIIFFQKQIFKLQYFKFFVFYELPTLKVSLLMSFILKIKIKKGVSTHDYSNCKDNTLIQITLDIPV